jgi:hypothetical protein
MRACELLETVFARTDHAVAREVNAGALDKGTALAVLTEFSRQIERWDRSLAERLFPDNTMRANP